MQTSGINAREIVIQGECDYEIPGTDEGTGYEELCDFSGPVDAWVDGGSATWTCPSCGAEHDETY